MYVCLFYTYEHFTIMFMQYGGDGHGTMVQMKNHRMWNKKKVI